jgi:hypothetical protein
MPTFINSRAMAQMVAFDLIQDDINRAEARRERRARRQVGAAKPAVEADVAAPTRPRLRVARALHLLH